MPVGYLWTVVVPAVAVTMALAPVRGPVGRVSWRLGFQVNELPFVVAAWITASTGLAWAQGDLATTGGRIGLGLALLTLAELGVVVVRSLRATPAVTEALSTSLGTEPTAGPTRLPWARILLTPLPVRERAVARTRNISYGPAGRYQLLDLYEPRRHGAGRPCLIHFHGGGYQSGRKSREAKALILRLAGEGWVCVSANYHLRSGFPEPLYDAEDLIAWVRRNAALYGVDPERIFVSGSSAGAHLAATAALTEDTSIQRGVAGAICLYGFYTAPRWIRCEPGCPSAPIDEIHPAAPPFFVVHGTADTFVPVDGARKFTEQLRAVSNNPVVYAELPGAQHTFDLYRSIRLESVINGITEFAASVSKHTERVES